MAKRRIRLLGEPAILDESERRQPLRGFQAWALLARVLLTRQPVDRRTLASELFPETADPLGALRWSLASLRKALDCSDCLNGDPVTFGYSGAVDIDVWRLDAEDFDIEAAGPLLGDFEPRSSPEFATWLLVERARIAVILESRIRQDTLRAISVGDHRRAVRLAEIGARQSPFDERAHVLLVKSLALSGQYDAATRHAEATEAVFLAELGERPSPALRSAARRTISAPPSGISQEAFVRSLIQSGLAALSAGAPDAGIDCLRRAVSDAEKIKGGPLHAHATLELGTALVHSCRGHDDEGSVLLLQSTEQARMAGDAGIAAAGFRELGYVEALAGRRPAAAHYLAQALGLAQDRNDLAGIHAVIGFNLVDWGKTSQGIEHYELSLEHARSTGNHRREIWTLGLGGWGLLAAERLDDADHWLDDCLALVEQQRWIAFRPWPVAVLSESRLRQDICPLELRPSLEQAFSLSCQFGDQCWEGAVARALALTYVAENDLPQAMEWLDEAGRRSARDTDGYAALQVTILADQARISRQQGRAEAADAFGREWVARAARSHMDGEVERAAAFIRQ
jgi:DNA-binding SARP family transcriptional activator